MKNFLYLSLSLLLLLTGCQDRTVKKLIEPVVDHPIEITTTSLEPATTTVILDEATAEVTSTDITTDQTSDQKTDQTTEIITTDIAADIDSAPIDTEVSAPIIVAKSDDLNDIDERTIILNEIDDLLDSTLSSLDELDQDSVSEDAIIKEGGLE